MLGRQRKAEAKLQWHKVKQQMRADEPARRLKQQTMRRMSAEQRELRIKATNAVRHAEQTEREQAIKATHARRAVAKYTAEREQRERAISEWNRIGEIHKEQAAQLRKARDDQRAEEAAWKARHFEGEVSTYEHAIEAERHAFPDVSSKSGNLGIFGIPQGPGEFAAPQAIGGGFLPELDAPTASLTLGGADRESVYYDERLQELYLASAGE
jgi:hypothetical protein